MKLFKKMKDGGEDSTVTGWWLIEWKRFFSVAILKFDGKSRNAYHSHAFNSISWLLRGTIGEDMLETGEFIFHNPSFKPIMTYRDTFHKVDSIGNTYILTFRGPWSKTWKEYIPDKAEYRTLGSKREILNVKADVG